MRRRCETTTLREVLPRTRALAYASAPSFRRKRSPTSTTSTCRNTPRSSRSSTTLFRPRSWKRLTTYSTSPASTSRRQRPPRRPHTSRRRFVISSAHRPCRALRWQRCPVCIEAVGYAACHATLRTARGLFREHVGLTTALAWTLAPEKSRALCDQHGDGQGIGATTGRVSGGRTGTVRACPPARCMCCGRLRAGGRVQSRQQRYGPGREAGSGAAPRRKYNRDLPMCERTRGLPTSAWPLTRRLGPAADRGARARAPRASTVGGSRASRPSRGGSGVSRHDGVTTTELGVTTTELGAALARRGRARWPLPTMGR